MEDFALNKNTTGIISSDIQLVKQQIDILFDTKYGDLMGDVDYGTDYMTNLYDLKLTPSKLSQKMEKDLENLDLMGFAPSVTAYFLDGTYRDIAVIEVTLTKDGYSTTVSYAIK